MVVRSDPFALRSGGLQILKEIQRIRDCEDNMDFKVLTDLIENGLPFQKMLGIRVASIEEGRVRLFIPFREDLIGDARRPAVHGGVISTLADVCAGFAVWTRCKLDDRIATIDLRVDYLRPATAHVS